ncbi:uncharacterized protein DUF3768 [Hephaestia caeni]|uniref:Uncharacterized protein DUF3768 n=1 Tax=Hephaestia caeni TaxID=645617 RepID=A0A397PGW9_9SPHN|nr:DUF3768 domain-containing protein [Hephaestia caeni]RIA46407.1 uncharacterized protein DUF3768 [Hephaestia caeni]
MTSHATSRTERIAQLNDRCRQGLDRNARIVITSNCLARLAPSDDKVAEILAQAELMRAIRQASFDRDSPERDMGSVTVGDIKVLFKIDYYDPNLEYGSEDPADAAQTTRVLTIMLPEDY